MRKKHPAFRMTTAAQVGQNIHFDEQLPAGTIAYTINGAAVNDSWKKVWIAFNGTGKQQAFTLPEGKWAQAMQQSSRPGSYSGSIDVEKYSAVILHTQ